MSFTKSTSEEVGVKIENKIIKNSLQEELLGIVIDNSLTFEPHMENLCKEYDRNSMPYLARIVNYMDISKNTAL